MKLAKIKYFVVLGNAIGISLQFSAKWPFMNIVYSDKVIEKFNFHNNHIVPVEVMDFSNNLQITWKCTSLEHQSLS